MMNGCVLFISSTLKDEAAHSSSRSEGFITKLKIERCSVIKDTTSATFSLDPWIFF
jgi:hypothetical protein